MEPITSERIRKSETLTAELIRDLTKWVNNQPTKIDAALILGLTRPTLDRILAAKSARPDSIEKIKKVLYTIEQG